MSKTNNLFYYHKSLDARVVKAVEKVLKVKVKKAVKMKHGEVNHVYKVTSDKGPFLVKVFKNKGWPENTTLPWVERQMLKFRIAHPKILYYDRSDAFFTAGFMVTEFIEGINGEVAVKTGKLTLAKAFRFIGKTLRKVHSIKLKKFGAVNNGKGHFSHYMKYVVTDAREQLRNLSENKLIPENISESYMSTVTKLLGHNVDKYKPVLVHRDASRENAVYGKDGIWYIVDWDNAKAGIWLEDYAELTFWTDWNRSEKEAVRRRKIIHDNFFIGYGKSGLPTYKLLKIEKALHLIKCLPMLEYYYFHKKDMKAFGMVKQKLEKLLE